MAGLKDNSLSKGYMNTYDQSKTENWVRYGHPNYNVAQKQEFDYRTQLPLNYAEQVSPDEDSNIEKYVGLGVGIVSLVTKNLLSHPFVVLRRQCQVHNTSKRYHLVPVTLIPVIVHLHQRQGITTLWKGLGSVLLVRGMTLGLEDLISKITPWPKDISWHSSFKSFGQHILLKCVSLTIITPFFSASLVETVQSDIASEKPGILDVFREGAVRLLSWGVPQRGRMLPVWALVVPTVTLGLAQYLFSLIIQGTASRILHARQKYVQEKRGALPKDILSQPSIQDIEISSTLIASLASEVVFYPFETIVHRLHLQGTRTIVDNLDSGYSVLPILTSYEGGIDCYETTVNSEGISGLYKGFGALILQFIAHVAVVRLTKFILTEISILLRPSPKPAISTSSQPVSYPQQYMPPENYLIQ